MTSRECWVETVSTPLTALEAVKGSLCGSGFQSSLTRSFRLSLYPRKPAPPYLDD